MSHKGKMLRGAKWWSKRNIEGNLPGDIKDDPNKMKDVDYFLEQKKKEVVIPNKLKPKVK